jgi:hypothetical protein
MSGFKTFPDYVKDPSMPFGVRYIGTNIVLNNPSFPLGFEMINLPTDLYCDEGDVKYTPNHKIILHPSPFFVRFSTNEK